MESTRSAAGSALPLPRSAPEASGSVTGLAGSVLAPSAARRLNVNLMVVAVSLVSAGSLTVLAATGSPVVTG